MKLINNTLYNDDFQPEKYKQVLNDLQCESESVQVISSVEWCPEVGQESGTSQNNIKEAWETAVKQAAEVAANTNVLAGHDQRPYLVDPVLGHLLVDSGSAVTVWPPEPGDKVDNSKQLRAVNGSRLKCYGFKNIAVRINRKEFKFKAIKADVSTPILGWDFIRHHKLNFVWNNWGDILVKDRVSKVSKVLEFKPLPQPDSDMLSSLRVLEPDLGSDVGDQSLSSHMLVAELAALSDVTKPVDTGEPDMSVPEQDINLIPPGEYKDLVARFPDLLKQDFTSDLSKTGVIHRIETASEAPCRAKARPLPANSPKAAKGLEAWQQLIKLGIVEKVPAGEPNNWSSPLHFAEKGDGSMRPVGDYRQLNLKTVLDLYPIKHIKSFTQDISGSVLFSKVDLFKAFHQIVIDPQDRHKTCVTTPWGLYNFRRLSMGMQNSAQSFQRVVDSVLDGLPNVYAYLDDILVFSKSKQEHMETLADLFSRLSSAGLTLNLKKCEFGRERIDFLGYHVDKSGISPIQKKVEIIAQFPQPQKQKELLGFLGSINYYRASLPNLTNPDKSVQTPAEVLDPLYKLATCKLSRQASFSKIWEESPLLQQAFKQAKELLIKAVNLTFPDPSAPLALTTDASKFAVGAQLDQFVDGHWRPLGLWSKALNPSQRLYTTYKRELLAIKFAMRHFNQDIQGRNLAIYTDHRPLLGSFQRPELQQHDPVVVNAINEIAQFTTDIRFKSGARIPVADWLSRQQHSDNNKAPDWSKSSCPPNSNVVNAVSQPFSFDPSYVSPDLTLAALEEVALHSVSPEALAEAQKSCQEVKSHREGLHPKNVVVKDVLVAGHTLLCEVSDPLNPRPLVPADQRNVVLNLLHHGDHPSIKETTRRVSSQYYWPSLRNQVTEFVRSCHPCQVAKQSSTVNPGVGEYPIVDKRFSFIHIDVVGPLPESEGYKYLLSIYDRCSKWFEALPMRNATSDEVCKAFIDGWVQRYGLPQVAVSDNGNTFIANLYKDMQANFNVKVQFTPAYHAAGNGAIERQHQTVKNALKAALVDMGNSHKDKWMRALSWVLLGKRNTYLPSLDASSAQMVLNMSPRLPGQIFSHPGPPLNSIQLRGLLDQLYRLSDRPGPPHAKKVSFDISDTNSATHVYIKQADPKSLSPTFEGPYKVVSRPSRSTVQVQLSVKRDGTPHLQSYHWSWCKPAVMRSGAEEASRPRPGRPSSDPKPSVDPTPSVRAPEPVHSPRPDNATTSRPNHETSSPLDPLLPSRPTRATRNPAPRYVDAVEILQ